MAVNSYPQLLSGVKILDLSRVLAGPYCTQILGDYGAEVIKIEDPHGGDITRSWGPPFSPDQQSAYFMSVNRNKKNLYLDLKTASGQKDLHSLVQRSDVVVANFLKSTAVKLRADFNTLKKFNKRLVYCAITGYGYSGPFSHKSGFDLVLQAETGYMSITGPEKGEPYKVGVATIDVLAGLHAVNAVLAALLGRAIHNTPATFIDIALYDCAISGLVNVAQSSLITGKAPVRYGNAHPNIVPYQQFKAKDGYIVIAVGTDEQFAQFCNILGLPKLALDRKFAKNADRVKNRKKLIPLLTPVILRYKSKKLLELLEYHDIPAGHVQNVHEALTNEYAQARGLVTHSRGFPSPLLSPVPIIDGKRLKIRLPPPK